MTIKMTGKPSAKTVWRLKKHHDKRIRMGHPWVFSNELEDSPKGIAPGTPIELKDCEGRTVAHGYGNPHSLIAFRALSWDQTDDMAADPDSVRSKILRAWFYRNQLGYQSSYRMVFSESDGLAGLVIDRYLHEGGQVLAVQILTSGMDAIIRPRDDFFNELIDDAHKNKISEFDLTKTTVVIRCDVNIRRLEGLEVEKPMVLFGKPEAELRDIQVRVGPDAIGFYANLFDGQKTGFFLDQAYNIELIASYLEKAQFADNTVRILDLCCYVGQWSTCLGYAVNRGKLKGRKVEVTQLDVSEEALGFAKRNAEAQGLVTTSARGDVLNDLGRFPDRYFDVVIADPPAFIKNKKDIPVGRAAYQKLNHQSSRLVRPGGILVSCSCSGVFLPSEFYDAVHRGFLKGKRENKILFYGGMGPDHPQKLGFPEGSYLKAIVNQLL